VPRNTKADRRGDRPSLMERTKAGSLGYEELRMMVVFVNSGSARRGGRGTGGARRCRETGSPPSMVFLTDIYLICTLYIQRSRECLQH
jgi:hypothetical protein